MIIVNCDLKSAISSSRDRRLCHVEIANVADRGSRADYVVRLYSKQPTRGVGRLVREAEVRDWPKNAKPAWRLIQAAFEALGE